jgi:hypothetical protein
MNNDPSMDCDCLRSESIPNMATDPPFASSGFLGCYLLVIQQFAMGNSLSWVKLSMANLLNYSRVLGIQTSINQITLI